MVAVEYHDAPVWLTESYLENVLQNYKKDKSLKIASLEIKPATAKGENYASIMTRVKLTFTQGNSKTLQEESYLAKTSYENDEKVSEIMKHYDPYTTEMMMYQKILPQLNSILRETGETAKLFADTIHVDFERSAIIFEDLSVNKYVMADRLSGMDRQHTLLSLKKLAQMHATAAVFNERFPNILTKFNRGIFNRHTRGFAPFFETMLIIAAGFAEKTPELGSYYKEKLIKLSEKVVDYATAVHDPKEGFFNTLTHGDYWVNNLMVQYNEERPKNINDMKIIDFQFCNWASPAVDLHYLINTSLEGDLRFNHQEELIKYYHENLVGILKALNFKGYIPTLHKFCVQLEVDRFYAVTSSLVVQPVMINSKTEDADFQAILGNDERSMRFKNLLYKNKKIQENVKKLLPVFDRRGLLDVDN